MMASSGIAQKPRFSAAIQTDGYKKLINNTLQDPKRAQRFIASVSSAVAVNPALQSCDAGTILSCALLGESLNLSPSPQLGLYYMIPFDLKEKRDNKTGEVISPATTVATFVLGWKGYAQLAMRSGQYKNLNVCAVKKGEFVSYDPFRETVVLNPISDPLEREVAETVGYYAFFEYLNGFKKELYWSKEKMIQHAERYSKAVAPNKNRVSLRDYMAGKYDAKNEWAYSSFWHKDFDVMACKTMLRQLISKWGIMSIEMRDAFEHDEKVVFADGATDFVDNNDITQARREISESVQGITVDESTGEVISMPDEAADTPGDPDAPNVASASADPAAPPQMSMADL